MLVPAVVAWLQEVAPGIKLPLTPYGNDLVEPGSTGSAQRTTFASPTRASEPDKSGRTSTIKLRLGKRPFTSFLEFNSSPQLPLLHRPGNSLSHLT